MVVIVVALAVWTISVAMAPHKVPRSGVAAALLSTVRNAEPASALSPSDDRRAQQKQTLTAQDGNGC